MCSRSSKTSNHTRARVFDAFPFFNEDKVLEVRLRELDDSVDVFVPAEATVTHKRRAPRAALAFAATRFRGLDASRRAWLRILRLCQTRSRA